MTQNLNKTLATCAAALLLCTTSYAVPYNVTVELDDNPVNFYPKVGDVDFGAVPGGNSPADNLAWLLDNVDHYNDSNHTNPDAPLPTPTTDLVYNGENLSDNGPTIPVEAGDYLVLHYGTGKGGAGKGGGLVAIYFDAAGTYDIPDFGAGPNGFGGVSSARLFDHTTVTTPDAGATAVLLGMVFLGVEGVRRKFARK